MEKLNIPILPVHNLVFFPRTTVPLNVEDKNVIQMIKDCLEFECPIGLSLADEQGPFSLDTPKKICGIGHPYIIEETENELKVIITGSGKVKIGALLQNFPYPVYEVEMIEQENELLDGADPRVVKLRQIFELWLDQSVLTQTEKIHFLEALASIDQICDYISMFIIHDAELRQILLETNSLNDRIQILSLLLSYENPFQEVPFIANSIKEFERLEKASNFVH
jgi:ATP-dependent Lon protease